MFYSISEGLLFTISDPTTILIVALYVAISTPYIVYRMRKR